jgi:hypothetical protein
MNLFREIEGLQGEKLASKVLSLLLLRSQELRSIFIDMISDESPNRPLSTWSRFACVCEQRTENEDTGAGYVDILIETDDAVIGIENKFHAPLGRNQPEKYLITLQEKASHLNALVGKQTAIDHLLVVLLPKDRRERESKALRDKGCVVLAWQDVLDAFKRITAHRILDPTTDAILRILDDFVLEKIGFMPNFTRLASHFRKNWAPSGNHYQYALLTALREVFPYPNNRIGTGRTWAGYYFATLLQPEQRGWFGFVPSENITDVTKRGNAAELIVATRFDVPSLSSTAFISVNVPNILGPKVSCNAWIINFDRQWSSPEKWREELNPFWSKVESLQEKTVTEVGGPEANPSDLN